MNKIKKEKKKIKMLTFNYGNSRALLERISFQVCCAIRKMGVVDVPTITRWLAMYKQNPSGVLSEQIQVLKEVRSRNS